MQPDNSCVTGANHQSSAANVKTMLTRPENLGATPVASSLDGKTPETVAFRPSRLWTPAHLAMPALCDGSATQFHQSSYRDIQPPETRMKQADPESDSAQETVRAEREVLTQTLPGTKKCEILLLSKCRIN